MKKFILSITWVAAASIPASPQTVAQDWTGTDCSGNPHALFADYLDQYKVVLMEFGMGCSSCGVAGQYFMQLKNKYAISHPGEFKFFYMDYWVSNDCATDTDPFLASWSITPDASFEHCSNELAYYMPGSPMPGYVIVAGPYHAVYFNTGAFNYNDTALVRATIDQALADMADVSVTEQKKEMRVSGFPNPANTFYQLQFSEMVSDATIHVRDIAGKTVAHYACQNINQFQLDVSNYKAGMYYVTAETHEQIQTFAVQVSHE